MLNNILIWFFGVVTSFFSNIINIVTTPIMTILRNSIPNFDSYFNTLSNFINNYIFTALKFGKMAIVNTLKIDHNIFNICVLIFSLGFAVFLATRSLKLISNIWSLKDNGKTKN